MFKVQLHAANEALQEYTEVYLRYDVSANKFAGFNGEYADAFLSNYVPFHGDLFTLATVHELVSRGGVRRFLELGSYMGGTSLYAARNLGLDVKTCEPFATHYKAAADILDGVAVIQQEKSLPFLERELKRGEGTGIEGTPTLIYVDSHGYGFDWDLLEELRMILASPRGAPVYVLIDDFRIPGRPEFGFDSYKGHECSLDYIGATLRSGGVRSVYLSDYSVVTSSAHGLRGTCLFCTDDAVDTTFLSSPKLGWKKIALN